jgi:UDPglucose--hexose-1-phosphate uridylyltransferase
MSLIEHPHRRHNPLTDEWILVSPHRTQRPWQGKTEAPPPPSSPPHDPACYLCPGNVRAGGQRNPPYLHTFSFTNDFPALLPHAPEAEHHSHGLFTSESVEGTCHVLCFSPRHDLCLSRLSTEDIRGVVDLWGEETETLGKQYPWVQIFENKGEIMGCSNPHPHGQVWAGTAIPHIPQREHDCQQRYAAAHSSLLLLDYLEEERGRRERLIVQNEHWTALVPYWAVWPYEVLLLPHQHVLRIFDLDDTQRDALAALLKQVMTRLDNLFETPFPYTMGWHGAPFHTGPDAARQLHAHIYPPLLRSATIKKFMVGYEMLAEPQRDITPESAAGRLRELSDIHYAEKNP